MLDFLVISTRSTKRGVIEIFPKFVVNKKSDLMIRGSDFYAVWDEEKHLWSTDESDVVRMVDQESNAYAKAHKDSFEGSVKVLNMWDSSTGMIDSWHHYCQKQCRDNYHMLDEKLIFSDTDTKKEDYASKKLDYPLKPGDISGYDDLMSVLYSPEERKKIEWAIGAVVNGDSKTIQKFLVLYGASGTGKSTVLNIIQQLFDGYYCVFDAKALGSANAAFALEPFKSNPLVAIQHDGDLSRIEDNTRLNSLVSHEIMTVNEKFKSTYANRFKCFLFMGTNKPVKITDAKSGIIRRLIDVQPTGDKVPLSRYRADVKKIKFELGAIACHCRDVYMADPNAYDNYIPINMLGASNDFYNFIEDSYDDFKRENGTTLKAAWESYKKYCTDANVTYPYSQRAFKEELKNYFKVFLERSTLSDGSSVRNYYSQFKFNPGTIVGGEAPKEEATKSWLDLSETESIFDKEFADCFAQYAKPDETPAKKWDSVTTKLSDLDTTKLHYVRTPEKLIVIDFDIKNEKGEKDEKRNLEEAEKWPPTYAEWSKSGSGLHLHYFYDGDPSELCSNYDENIEVKVFRGNSALRRKLTKCNSLLIAAISSGLPLKKGGSKVVSSDMIKSERGLRNLIERNLRKEIHGATKPSVDFIFQILEDAYNSGMTFDVNDMRPAILSFAANSSHHSLDCVKVVSKMHFESKDAEEKSKADNDAKPIVIFDMEVYSNLFVVCWKKLGEGVPIVRMINPDSDRIAELRKNYRLVGFNNRDYDNHILYAREMGYTNQQLFDLSQRIINGKSKVEKKNAMFGNAYDYSYADIYDFSSVKQSLKKFEIEYGIHHQEMDIPWDQPVPDNMVEKVVEYCCNDVMATEVVWNKRHADFEAREILAKLATVIGGVPSTVNDTTNTLTNRLIFGSNRHPQSDFNYRDLAEKTDKATWCYKDYLAGDPKANIKYGMPYFPGYKYEGGISTYRGDEIGEGGRVFANPGIYGKALTKDVASMHPHSVTAENLFGDRYTPIFAELLNLRVAIKHKDYEKAKSMFNGAIAELLTDEASAKGLSSALKIAINSVYGLTSAKFDNPFRDIRNVDNIVAKRGALFMTDLKNAVEEKGFTVIHIKTDSIKISNPTPEILKFVEDMGKAYGYDFETEAIFDKLCLVNDAVYIAKCSADSPEDPGQWTATGTQFAVPYVFKTLFTHEPIAFEDMCETKSVTTSLYLDMNEKLSPDDHDYHFVGRVGLFCPMTAGVNAGELMREKEGKYYAVTGTKGYRWMEAEMVKTLQLEDKIDKSYYQHLVDAAIESISKYGDFNAFVSDDFNSDQFGQYMNIPDTDKEELPFDDSYVVGKAS